MTEETTERENQGRGAAASDIAKRGWTARDVISAITGRKRVEEALRETEERFQRLAENAAAIIFRYRLSPTPGYEYISPAVTTLTGYTPDEFYADPDLDIKIVHPEDRETLLRMIKAELTGPRTLRWIRKDGSTIWAELRYVPIHEGGNLVAFEGIASDTTGHKRAEEALLESEERWRSLVESIPDIIMTVDADGTILFINRTVLGFTVEGTIGRKVYDYVPPEHHDTMRKRLEAVFKMGEAHDFEIGGAGPFGRTSWYFNRIGPVVQNGRVVAATLIATDITEKRQAEEALRESEERYRDVVQNISETIYEMDANGRITYITPAAEQAIGYPPSEIVGRPFADFFHPDDLSSAVQGFQRALSGHPTPNQFRLLSRTGEVIWVRSFGRPILEGDRTVGVRGVLTDVSESKRAEQAARDSEARFRSTLDNMMEGALIIGFDWRYLYANDAVARHTSWRKEELLGHTMMEMQPDIENTKEFAHLRRCMEERVPHRMEWRYAYPDGATAWFDVSIQPVPEGIFMLFLNMTERKRAEEALRESEERYRDLAENLNDAIFEFNPSGRMTYVSPGMEGLSGYDASEMIGGSITDLVHPDDLASVTEKVQKRPFGNREPSEYRLLTKSGEARWVRSLGLPMLEGDRVVGFRAVLTDITEHKRAEEALRESEKRYRHLVENVNEAIYELDANARVTYISPVVEEIGGYSPSEIVGRPATDFVHPDDMPRALEGLQTAMSGHPTPNEYRLLTKTGNTLWVRSFGRPVLEGDRVAGIRGVLTDITEHKRAEEALRESEKRYRELVEEINDIVFALDATGRLEYISPAVTDISGYSPSEMIGRPFTDFVDPDDVPSAMERFRRSLSGNHEPIELRFVSKLGELHWLRSSARPILDGDRVIGLRGVQTDITESKRAEEALRESEERFRQVATTAHDWISEVDAEGRFTYSSPAVKEILGYEAEEVIGKHFYDFYPAEEREQLLAGARRIGAEKRAYSGAIARNVHKDGHTVIVESSGLPILDAEGNVTGYRNVARDVTERERAEEELREAEGRYRSLIEASPDAITLSDLNANVIMVNDQTARLHGFDSTEEMVGLSSFDFIAPEDRERARENAQKTLETGTIRNIEYTLLRKDGTRFPAELSASLIVDAVGNPVAFTGVTRDITERKRAEEELRESEARLRAFANAVPDIAFILDENGLYVEVLALPETKDLLYANGEALKGRRLHDVLPEKTADRFLSVVRKTIETQEPQILEYVLDVQAGRRWFEGRTAPLSLVSENQMVVWISRDITERKQAEAGRQKVREEIDRKAERLAERGNVYGLTFRELVVLDLVSAGKPDREIATLLGIRPRTVSKHVENIRAKMGASSRTEAGVRAVKEGLLK